MSTLEHRRLLQLRTPGRGRSRRPRREHGDWLSSPALSSCSFAYDRSCLVCTIGGPCQRPASVAGGFHSIAVLPFVNLAQNSDQDYIVDGMTDQLITDLASSTPLRVISRSSVMHYKGMQVPMGEIAQALNVDAVLEGSFLHTGKEVRITANLIDARNDRHLWAQVYEESGNDLLRCRSR